MSEDWPTPGPGDDTSSTAVRRPARSRQSYALRQASVLLGVLVVAAAVIAFVVSRNGDGGGDRNEAVLEPPTWDAVVLVDPASGRVVVTGSDGVELAGGASSVDGALDIGVAGTVVLGATGAASASGLGVVDLATGLVEPLRVDHDRITRLGDGPVLVASDGERTTSRLQIVDAARLDVRDLTTIAGPDAIVPLDGIIASPSGDVVALTDLAAATTVLVELAGGGTATVPGQAADLSDDRVATITNRGDTVLVDLFDVRGARIGTVETDHLAGLLVTGPDEAIAVTTSGAVLRLRFGASEIDESARLGGDGVDADVLDVAIVASRQRLAVTVAGSLRLIDGRGHVADTVTSSIARPLLDDPTPGARCVHLVGSSVEPSLLIDTTRGDRVAAIEPGSVVARSADGCVVALQRLGSTVTNVIGADIDLDVGDPVLAVAPDGSAMVVGGTRPRLVMLDDVTEIRLPRTASAAVFARRATEQVTAAATEP